MDDRQEDRQELTERIAVLREYLTEGKMYVPEHLGDSFQDSLGAILYDDDGLVLPETVDGSVRALSLVISHQHFRKKLKDTVSVREVQEAYYRLVESLFSDLYSIMCDHNASPHAFAAWFVNQPDHVARNHDTLWDFVKTVKDFWENASPAIWAHAEDQDLVKAVFGGEIFPDTGRNPAHIIGVYVDTVILPDPFLKMLPLLQKQTERDRVYEIIRLAMHVLQHKTFVLAEIEPPLAVIVPDKFALEDWYRDHVLHFAQRAALCHAGRLFGREFSSTDEVEEFVSVYGSPAEIADAIERPELVMIDTAWSGTAADQIARLLETYGDVLPSDNAGLVIWFHIISRMTQASDVLRRSAEVRGVPIIQAPTSWRWLNWRLGYDAQQLSGRGESLHVVRALNEGVGAGLSFLGNVSIDALVELRQTGQLGEMRELLSSGLKEIVKADPSDFAATTSRVLANLRRAFKRHERTIEGLRRERRVFAGRDVGSLVAIGAVEIAAVISGDPLLAVAGVAAALSGGTPTVKDLKAKWQQIKDKSEAESTTVTALMFDRRGTQ